MPVSCLPHGFTTHIQGKGLPVLLRQKHHNVPLPGAGHRGFQGNRGAQSGIHSQIHRPVAGQFLLQQIAAHGEGRSAAAGNQDPRPPGRFHGVDFVRKGPQVGLLIAWGDAESRRQQQRRQQKRSQYGRNSVFHRRPLFRTGNKETH